MSNNRNVTNFAIIEMAILFIATFICLFIKLYTDYDIGWVVCLYPFFVFCIFNIGIICHSFYLLFTANKIEDEEEKEDKDE